MNDETDMPMPMSDGEMSGDKPDTKPSKDGKRTYGKPLKIRGSLDDALRVLVGKPRRKSPSV